MPEIEVVKKVHENSNNGQFVVFPGKNLGLKKGDKVRIIKVMDDEDR